MSASAYAAAAAPVAKDEFPWKYELGISSLDIVNERRPFKLDGFPYHMEDAMNDEEEWPYYYARPMHESFVPSHKHSPSVRLVRMMNPTQRLFMEFYAPNNIPKLHSFFQLTKERRVQLGAAIFEAYDKTTMLPYPSKDSLAQLVDMPEGAKQYQRGSFAYIQQVIKKHSVLSKASSLADLQDFFRRTKIRTSGDVDDKQAPIFEREDVVSMYRQLFAYPENSTAVPLPVGLVLFEGRSHDTYKERITSGQTRREVFSTSWHPDASLGFIGSYRQTNMSYEEMSRSRASVLVIHKIVSPGIMGFDVQEYAPRPEKTALSHEHPKSEMYAECEIIVQPFVRVHEVNDNVHLFHIGSTQEVYYPESIKQTVAFVRTIFTHLYLGDKCPCGNG